MKLTFFRESQRAGSVRFSVELLYGRGIGEIRKEVRARSIVLALTHLESL